jgi:uncharacterized phage-associated protein
VPDIYHSFKDFGRGPIDPEQVINRDFDWDRFRGIEEFLLEIWDRYGSLAAWTLREKTHREPPWQEAFEDGVRHKEIGFDHMKGYFSSAS